MAPSPISLADVYLSHYAGFVYTIEQQGKLIPIFVSHGKDQPLTITITVMIIVMIVILVMIVYYANRVPDGAIRQNPENRPEKLRCRQTASTYHGTNQ